MNVTCLTEEQTREVGWLLSQYVDVSSKGTYDLGCTNFVNHHIHKDDAALIKMPPRRTALAQGVEMEKTVAELREEASSSYFSDDARDEDLKEGVAERSM
ncbi:hypothetical protein E2C01_063868 [Portunus trituberculatus]|uniref:Uncharacterized protein n=1 Tax=Portunus trituberculatus TaxID=210409 RepID=A0A5B7HLQ9_PORTR|nr:hypothetical protein [Portunus trituberculatus]